ncbi:RelA/SpoT domain-containing protein [Raineyella antarctica]|nr:RelA/SpoT domain-containing protein [Raineyella antarctica]
MTSQPSAATDPPSKNQVRQAGRTVRHSLQMPLSVDEETYAEAIAIIERHRAAHARPMVTANVALRQMCRRLGLNAKVTQRLKRMETIRDKLLREPGLNLDRMQDFGGCRVIVPTIEDAYRLRDRILRRHPDARVKDYVAEPRGSGYRAIHVIAEYGLPKKPIEIQIRTPEMHEWADMVERVSGMLGINYKQEGHAEFQLWAKVLSRILELQAAGRPVPEALRENYAAVTQRLFRDLEGR